MKGQPFWCMASGFHCAQKMATMAVAILGCVNAVTAPYSPGLSVAFANMLTLKFCRIHKTNTEKDEFCS